MASRIKRAFSRNRSGDHGAHPSASSEAASDAPPVPSSGPSPYHIGETHVPTTSPQNNGVIPRTRPSTSDSATKPQNRFSRHIPRLRSKTSRELRQSSGNDRPPESTAPNDYSAAPQIGDDVLPTSRKQSMQHAPSYTPTYQQNQSTGMSDRFTSTSAVPSKSATPQQSRPQSQIYDASAQGTSYGLPPMHRPYQHNSAYQSPQATQPAYNHGANNAPPRNYVSPTTVTQTTTTTRFHPHQQQSAYHQPINSHPSERMSPMTMSQYPQHQHGTSADSSSLEHYNRVPMHHDQTNSYHNQPARMSEQPQRDFFQPRNSKDAQRHEPFNNTTYSDQSGTTSALPPQGQQAITSDMGSLSAEQTRAPSTRNSSDYQTQQPYHRLSRDSPLRSHHVAEQNHTRAHGSTAEPTYGMMQSFGHDERTQAPSASTKSPASKRSSRVEPNTNRHPRPGSLHASQQDYHASSTGHQHGANVSRDDPSSRQHMPDRSMLSNGYNKERASQSGTDSPLMPISTTGVNHGRNVTEDTSSPHRDLRHSQDKSRSPWSTADQTPSGSRVPSRSGSRTGHHSAKDRPLSGTSVPMPLRKKPVPSTQASMSDSPQQDSIAPVVPPKSPRTKSNKTDRAREQPQSRDSPGSVSRPGSTIVEKRHGPSSAIGENPGHQGSGPTSSSVPSAQTIIERAGHSTADTTVTETVAPAVIHEVVNRHIHHIREEQVTREIHNSDVFHRMLPVIDVEVLPARHFLPVEGGGLVEIDAENVPGRGKNWIIAETVSKIPSDSTGPGQGSGQGHQILPTSTPREFSARAFPGKEGDTISYRAPDGHTVTEQTWVHPPELESGARQTGQSWPIEFGKQGSANKSKVVA